MLAGCSAVHPILVRLDSVGLALPSYGVMLLLSFVAAWFILMHFTTKKEGLDRSFVSSAFILAAVMGIVGARALYVATNLGTFESPLQWLDLRRGGMVAYGGFIAGYVTIHIFFRIKNIPFYAWGDSVVPTLALGLALTRIGCYLFGCDFGQRLGPDAPSWLAALGTFPRWDLAEVGLVGSPAWMHHVQSYGHSPFSAQSLPVHPTQLYEAVAGLGIFFASLWLWKGRTFRGQVGLTVVLLYSVWRFFIELLRDDPERGEIVGLSTSQLISLILIPVAVFFYLLARRGAGDGPPPSLRGAAAGEGSVPP